MDSIEAPRFKGLESVDVAKATLRTFFMVLLDLNIYKRDLETKCIEQDEAILDLKSSMAALKELLPGDLSHAERNAKIRKQRAIG